MEEAWARLKVFADFTSSKGNHYAFENQQATNTGKKLIQTVFRIVSKIEDESVMRKSGVGIVNVRIKEQRENEEKLRR